MAFNNKIKFFKQIAILLSIVWTIMTYVFINHQMSNEQRHIQNIMVRSAKASTSQAEQLIKWAFDQRIKQKKTNPRLEIKTDFSLRDLIYRMARQEGSTIRIETNYLESDLLNMDQNVKQTIREAQVTKKEKYSFYEQNDGEHLFYFKPLLTDESCVKCHIHNDKEIGDLLGSVNISMPIPTLKEYNKNTFYFLIFTYLSTWLCGLAIIWWVRYKSKRYLDEKMQNYEESIYSLVDMMEKRDSYTAGHSKRVAYYSFKIAKKMGLSKEEADLIYKAGMLHDIGKIEIPDALLLKPDTLTDAEYEMIKRHSKASYELLCREPFTNLSKIVLHHHERYDGKGYPYGLRGYQVPLLSQIISVADAYDAITTSRAYRKASSKERAFEILEECKGTQFNPEIVDVAKEVLALEELPKSLHESPEQIVQDMQFSYYYRDQLTGHYNLQYFKFLLAHQEDYKILCIYNINCLNFSKYNKKYGWKKGDKLLENIAGTLHEACPKGFIIRVFGDNFIVVHFDEHVELDVHVLDSILDRDILQIEFKHVNIAREDVTSLDRFEDILRSQKNIVD